MDGSCVCLYLCEARRFARNCMFDWEEKTVRLLAQAVSVNKGCGCSRALESAGDGRVETVSNSDKREGHNKNYKK